MYLELILVALVILSSLLLLEAIKIRKILAKKDMAQLSEEMDDDVLYDEVIEMIKDTKKVSASLIQRRFRVGYARAARLLDLMEANEIIGPADGANSRKVLVDN